jgi:hypothetical protein
MSKGEAKRLFAQVAASAPLRHLHRQPAPGRGGQAGPRRRADRPGADPGGAGQRQERPLRDALGGIIEDAPGLWGGLSAEVLALGGPTSRRTLLRAQLAGGGEARPPGQPGAALPAGPAEDFRLFPNPAHDSWRLGVPQAYIGQPMSIRIYSLAGQLAGSREVRAAAPFEPMEGRLESGLYFVEAWSGGQRVFIGRLAIMN